MDHRARGGARTLITQNMKTPRRTYIFVAALATIAAVLLWQRSHNQTPTPPTDTARAKAPARPTTASPAQPIPNETPTTPVVDNQNPPPLANGQTTDANEVAATRQM